MAAVEIPSRCRPQNELLPSEHFVDPLKLMSTSITITVPPNATAREDCSVLLIPGVDGIYVGPGLGQKGGNARTGAEKGGMQYW